MTDAKSANWNGEGEKDERKIDDLLPACVCDVAARDVVEDTLDCRPRDDFLLTIVRFNSTTPGLCECVTTKERLEGRSTSTR